MNEVASSGSWQRACGAWEKRWTVWVEAPACRGAAEVPCLSCPYAPQVPPPPRLCFGALPSGLPRRVPGVYARNQTPRIQWRGPLSPAYRARTPTSYPRVCPKLGGTHPLLPDGAPVWLCGVPPGGRLVASVRQPCGAVPRFGHTEEGHTPAGGLCGTRRDDHGRPARPPTLPPSEQAGERHRPTARCLSGHRWRRSGFHNSHPSAAYACVCACIPCLPPSAPNAPAGVASAVQDVRGRLPPRAPVRWPPVVGIAEECRPVSAALPPQPARHNPTASDDRGASSLSLRRAHVHPHRKDLAAFTAPRRQ